MVQLSGVVSSGNECVEEEVKCGDPAIASNDEVGSCIGRRLARPARYPSDAPGVMQFVRFGRGRVLEVGMGRPDRTRDSINLLLPIFDEPYVGLPAGDLNVI